MPELLWHHQCRSDWGEGKEQYHDPGEAVHKLSCSSLRPLSKALAQVSPQVPRAASCWALIAPFPKLSSYRTLYAFCSKPGDLVLVKVSPELQTSQKAAGI